MKKIIYFSLLCLFVFAGSMFAQDIKKAEIKFDKTSHNYGTFSEDNPIVTCVFTFTNTGTAPLIIHQAVPSCGCTVPEYTQEPVKPGESGKITISYNGAGRFPGHFKKSITVRSNAKTKTIRLYIEGIMKASEKKEKK